MSLQVNDQMQQVPFVDLKAQYQTIKDEIDTAITEVLTNTNFILGQAVADFESDFAAYCGTHFAIGVDSGLSALELVLRAYGIGPGDEVITAANTFIATALAISSVGATPILVDIDPATYLLDVVRVECAIGPYTKAIMPVHLYGHVADMDPITELAHRHNLKVIEDASQAHGARYKGRRVGGLGDAAAFSLYPAKNLGAYGDAGIIVTDDAEVAEQVRLLRNYGSIQKYHHEVAGFNRRLDTLHAAVLRVKLQKLDQWNTARRCHANRYRKLLDGCGIGFPTESQHEEAVYHLFVIEVDARDELQRHLTTRGISSVIHYPIPLHLQPAYQHLGYSKGDFPITERTCERILSLPIYPELSDTQIDHVVQAVHSFMFEANYQSYVPTLATNQSL